MDIGRRKNTILGIIYGFVNKFVVILFPFIIQTVIIRILGIEYAGIKGLFTSVLSIVSLTDLGIGSAITFCLYKPIAEDNKLEICALVNTCKRLYFFIGCIILIVGCIITPFIKLCISGYVPEDVNAYAIFVLYLLNKVASYWFSSYKSILLNAYHNNYILSNINTFITCIAGALQVMALLFTNNFYCFLIVEIIFTVINNIVVSDIVDKRFPDIKSYGKLDETLISTIKKQVKGIMIGKVCGVTRNAIDNIFISTFLGLTCTAVFSNYYYIFAALSSIPSIVLSALLPAVGNSVATESRDKNFNDLIRINFVYLFFSGWITIILLCLYQPFVSLWIGKEYLLPENIMILFPVYFYICRMGDVRSVYSDAAGLFWEERYRTMLEVISNVVLNFVLINKLGLVGVLVSTIFSLLIFGFLGSTYVIFKYYFNKSPKEYLYRQGINFSFTLFLSIFHYYICTIFVPGLTMKVLIIRLFICLVFPPLLYVIFYSRTILFLESFRFVFKK